MEIIGAKYPKAVFTGESAFYYHGLTDVIPDFYHLATVRTDGRIKDERVKQTFLKEDIFDMGQIKMSYHNTDICIYNLERMLIVEISKSMIIDCMHDEKGYYRIKIKCRYRKNLVYETTTKEYIEMLLTICYLFNYTCRKNT